MGSAFRWAAVFLLGALFVVSAIAEQSIDELRKKAEAGDADAQARFGFHYYKGDGVPMDAAEAVKWFRKAAEQGVAEAQSNLGVCYERGEGVPKDAVEAVKWYRKAVEQGLAEAQYNLGNCYHDGDCVPKDAAEAVKWFRKAADQGHAKAQYNLGVCYRDGTGVPKDAVQAVKWFRRAAEQGLAEAYYNLAVQYHNGEGVPRSLVDAYKWFNLAAAQGDEQAADRRRRLENQMPPSVIAEAQRLSREFRPRKEQPLPADTGRPSPQDLDARPTATGTAFFITDDGYLVTNHHVVEGGFSFRVVTSAGQFPAKLVKADKANDLAVLKVEAKARTAPLPIASSRGVKLGATVATVGFPNIGLQGHAPKLAKGDIASLTGIRDDPGTFQISVPVQPGNSGGPLVDGRGNVVGVIVAKLSAKAALQATGSLPENVNYAVKSSFLLSFLESLPDLSAKLPEPHTRDSTFETVVTATEKAVALVLVYQ